MRPFRTSIPSTEVAMLTRPQALAMLNLCDGEEIWSLDYCRQHRVPDAWISELQDAFESNPSLDRDAIYVAGRRVNQFEGVRAVDIAIKLAGELRVPLGSAALQLGDRSEIVRAVREAIEEG